MSLAKAEGHPLADKYTLGFLWNEVVIIRARLNKRIADDAAMMHRTLTTVLGGKRALEGFKKLLKEIENG